MGIFYICNTICLYSLSAESVYNRDLKAQRMAENWKCLWGYRIVGVGIVSFDYVEVNL